MAKKCKTKSIHLRDRGKIVSSCHNTGVRSPQNQVEPVRSGSSPLCKSKRPKAVKFPRRFMELGLQPQMSRVQRSRQCQCPRTSWNIVMKKRRSIAQRSVSWMAVTCAMTRGMLAKRKNKSHLGYGFPTEGKNVQRGMNARARALFSTPLKNMKVSWDHYSQQMESHKSHVPNHQPI